MSERPTPETDANIGFFDLETATDANFSRKLERERDEAREALKALAPLTHHDCSFYKDYMGNCIICKNKKTK